MIELPLEAEMRASIADVIRKSLAAATGALIEHENAIRTCDDVESVHQARVAARRIRSDLRTYKRFLDETWAAQYSSRAPVDGQLSRRRPRLDVPTGRVETIAWDLPAWERPHVTPVLDRLNDERGHARAALTAALDEPRYLRYAKS